MLYEVRKLFRLAASPLPSDSSNLEAISRFLIEVRRTHFDAEL